MSWFTGFFGFLADAGTTAKYLQAPEMIAKGDGREVTRVESVGSMTVKFNISLKNMRKFGYH